jgi:phosphomannomutase
LTRSTAAEIAGAMASCLWDTLVVPPFGGFSDQPHDGPPEGGTTNEGEGIRLLTPARPGPCLVLAHDERPSSPDIVTGVGQALRRMGCQVVDIGLATRPALLFGIEHLQAAGGVHVAGAGCDPGWTGLDFVSRDGIPCSRPGQLDQIVARYQCGYSRPSRRPGSQRAFQATVPYQAGLWKHFHALRPLKIALACPSRAVQDVFQHIFRKLACRLIPVETPIRARTAGNTTDPDVVRTSQSVRTAGADLGLLIEDDGEQCTFFDERGSVVEAWKVARRLAEVAIADESSDARIVLPAAWNDRPIGARATYVTEPNRERVALALRQEQAHFGTDGHGRYWFAEVYPACDALLTLVHLLQALSRSDASFSEVA